MADKEQLNAMEPDLVADVTLYEDAAVSLRAGITSYSCICTASITEPVEAYSAYLQLDENLNPGEQRRVGFLFLVPDGAKVMRKAGKFFLRLPQEESAVGEATVAN